MFILRYTRMMIKVLILTVYLAGTLLFASEIKTAAPLSYDASLLLLESIDHEAILLGSGKKQLYVFLDPLCLHSRKFISMVSKNPKMLSKYRYHLFLYSIARLKSEEVVAAIYTSKNPLPRLLEIMTTDKIYREKANSMTQSKVDAIALVGEKMDVRKRPYIFVLRTEEKGE